MVTTRTIRGRPGREAVDPLALRVDDVERSIFWYERFTPLRLLHLSADDYGVRHGWPIRRRRQPVRPRHRPIPTETDPFADSPTILGPSPTSGSSSTRGAVDDLAARAAADGI